MFKLNKQTEYGLTILAQLSQQKDYISLADLVKKTNLPPRFLARIAAKLTTNKLLTSKEGRVGGYKVTDYFKKANLFDYLQIFEGITMFVKCSDADYHCKYEKNCAHRDFFNTKLNHIVIDQLKKVRLVDAFH